MSAKQYKNGNCSMFSIPRKDVNIVHSKSSLKWQALCITSVQGW